MKASIQDFITKIFTTLKNNLKTVAFTGNYYDLSNRPTIPNVGNGTITITQNGTKKGTFTTNQNGNTTVELTDNNTTYSNFVKSGSGAKSGLVPAPSTTAGTTKYLREDGTWTVPPDTNTDTKVTAVGNHYTPSGGTTTSASGGTLTDITNSSSGVQVVTGVTKDAAGHVTGVTSVALKSTNTNTTYGNMTGATSSAAGSAGLVPAPAAGKQNSFLRGDGTWYTTVTIPSNGKYIGTYENPIFIDGSTSSFKSCSYALRMMSGASSSADGKYGLVPAPTAGKQASFLRGDGTWAVPTDTNTVTTATTTGSGNAVTAITASNGALTVTKGTTFLTRHQDISGKMDKVDPTGTGSFSLNRKAGTTVGKYSFAEGYDTTASDSSSHAEGWKSTASKNYSHAEGYYTTASGIGSHAEGNNTIASGNYSHAEGSFATVSGSISHAEGDNTTASGIASHAEGNYTIANGNYQHVQGKYNVADTTSAFIIGNGSSDSARSNAMKVDWNGNLEVAGDLKDGSGNTLLTAAKTTVDWFLVNKSYKIKMDGVQLPTSNTFTDWGLAIIAFGHTSDAARDACYVCWFGGTTNAPRILATLKSNSYITLTPSSNNAFVVKVTGYNVGIHIISLSHCTVTEI